MLSRVLDVSEEDLTWSHIEALVASRVPEDQLIEYTETLPANTDTGRHDFVREVVALANGGGGLYVVGIRDQDDTAAAVVPVPLGSERTRLHQLAMSRIVPPPDVRLHEVRRAPDDTVGVIIVEVRSSSNKPFAAVIDHRHEYPIRRGRHRDWLDEAAIDRLYRARHQRASEVEDRIDGLARRAGEQGGDFEHPRAFIAAAPTDPLGRVFRADTPTMRGLPTPSYMFGEIPVIEPQRRAGFRRIEAAASFEMSYIESAGWIEIHDDGAYLAVIPGEDSLPESNQPRAFFRAGMFVAQFLARLSGLRALSDHFDLQTEYDLAAGITAANLPAFLIADSPALSAPQDVRALTEPVTTHISIQLPADLNVLDPFLVTAKSLLDDLFTAFGWAGCPQITGEGILVPRAFGGGRSQLVSRWVESQQPHDDEEP